MTDTKMVMQAAHMVAKHLVGRTENYQIAFNFSLKTVWRFAKRFNRNNRNRVAAGHADLVKAYDAKDLYLSALSTLTMNSKSEFIFGVPTWVIRKNNYDLWLNINDVVSAKTIKETEKAVQIEFTLDRVEYGDVVTRTIWAPKSTLEK